MRNSFRAISVVLASFTAIICSACAATAVPSASAGNAIVQRSVGRSARISAKCTHCVVAEYTIPTASSGVGSSIIAGPDGNMWFTENAAGKVGKLTVKGLFTEYNVAPGGILGGITRGPDGMLWFLVSTTGGLGRVNPATGSIKTFCCYGSSTQFFSVTEGPDHNMWVGTSQYECVIRHGLPWCTQINPAIDVINPRGSLVKQIPLGTSCSNPASLIVMGSDRNLWFDDTTSFSRMTTGGVCTAWGLDYWPPGLPDISLGADGSVWFTENSANQIAKITTAGVITQYPVPTASSDPWGLAPGPNGNIWFAEWAGNKIGRITPAGAITEYPLPTPNSQPVGIALGPDGDLWVVEAGTNKIAQFRP